MSEGSMRRHDWILDMLSDLKDYAQANGLVDLALSVEGTLAVARRETAFAEAATDQKSARHVRTH
jgi:hypothetical protein